MAKTGLTFFKQPLACNIWPIGDVQQERQLHLAHKNSTLMMLFSSDSGHELWSVDVYKI